MGPWMNGCGDDGFSASAGIIARGGAVHDKGANQSLNRPANTVHKGYKSSSVFRGEGMTDNEYERAKEDEEGREIDPEDDAAIAGLFQAGRKMQGLLRNLGLDWGFGGKGSKPITAGEPATKVYSGPFDGQGDKVCDRIDFRLLPPLISVLDAFLGPGGAAAVLTQKAAKKK